MLAVPTRRLPNINKPILRYEHKPKTFLNVAVLKHLAPTRPRKTTIRQAFFDVSMVNNHEGLANILKKRGINPLELSPGDFVLFMNAAGTHAKILGANISSVKAASFPIVSIKAPRGKLSSLLLAKLPEFFHGQPFDYDATLKPILEAYLTQKRKRK